MTTVCHIKQKFWKFFNFVEYNVTLYSNNRDMVKYRQARKELLEAFCGTRDVLCLDFELGGRSAMLMFVDGLSDKLLMNQNIIDPLKRTISIDEVTPDNINKIISISDPIIVPKDIGELIYAIADGDIGLIVDGASDYMVLSLKNYKMRSIQEPPVSINIKGPREGFVEDMKVNMTMLRRRLRTPKLVFNMLKAGKYSKTNIAVAYIDGICDKHIVEEVERRIKAINIDGVLDSSYIARYVEDNHNSMFNQVGTSEKPDIVASKLLEGRLAIIVDGSPSILTLPFLLCEHFQASEDYYIKPYRATATRILRLFAMLCAIVLPSAYVALQEFQYQMLPLRLLVVIMNSIHGVPLTPTLEMICLLLLFEILNESSVRMPRYVGTALSIVGAIVLGETAVNAGLLSIPSVLVTAVSTIGLYCVPDEVESGSLLRIGFVIIAGFLGVFGVILASIVLMCYLASLKSFGTSYLSPLIPLAPQDLKDSFYKVNLRDMHTRPYSIPTTNRTREKASEDRR